MGKIIFKGNFTVEGDLAGLDLMCKRFKFLELETRNLPKLVISRMSGIPEKTSVHKAKLKEGK
ncbi:MAG TPA: hypothetical protein ENI23_13200 [bacterium]|nr:hypothetical protein [bacterium]